MDKYLRTKILRRSFVDEDLRQEIWCGPLAFAVRIGAAFWPLWCGPVRIFTSGWCASSGPVSYFAVWDPMTSPVKVIWPYGHTCIIGPCEWFGHDFQVLLVKLEQILHLKIDCSDFGPVRDRGSLPYLPTYYPANHPQWIGLRYFESKCD